VKKKSGKILMVDDDDMIRDVCSLVLTEVGYQVETAADGIEALNRLKDSEYDLVITDINMPRLDGIGLYLSVLREYPYLKDRFFFLTGNPSWEARLVLSEINSEYLAKPFHIDDFLRRIEILIEQIH